MTKFVAAAICLLLAALAHAQTPHVPRAFAGEATPAPDPRPRRFEAVKDPTPLPGTRAVRYFTTDEFDRVVVFYVDEPPAAEGRGDEKLPVIVYVQGSGAQSVYTRLEQGDKVRAAPSGRQGGLRQLAKDRAIVVIAEKPGVKFMECPSRPGGAEEASGEFRNEHTLARWSGAVSAAMKAAITLPRADPARVLVMGHSEGGLVASKVAADNPVVSHVCTLAGGGATQLFDLIELARRGDLLGGSASPEESVAWLLGQWDEVLKSPESAEAIFMGHPHRRWTSFLATSPLEELKRAKAKVFIGQGTDDKAVYPPGADVLFATLKAAGRDVTYSRVPGDHGFMVVGEDGRATGNGWQEMQARVVGWFLGG